MTGHLPDEVMQRFRKGDLPFEDWKKTDRHLAECPECRQRLLVSIGSPDGDAWWMFKQAEAVDGAHCPDPAFWLAWIEDRVSPTERTHWQSHLAACALCTETVERFRSLRDAEARRVSRLFQPEWIQQLGHFLLARRLRPVWAVILVCAVIVLLYVRWLRGPSTLGEHVRIANTRILPLRDTSGTVTGPVDRLEIPGVSTLDPEWSTRIQALLARGDISPLPPVAQTIHQLRESVPVRSVEKAQAQVPRPIAPVVTMVRHQPITFRWHPVAQAERYYIIVADAHLKRIVAELEAGTRTTYPWEDAPRYLQSGQVYAWQIEAWTPEMVYISGWARFAVLPVEAEKTIQDLEHAFRRSALALLTVYLAYGLYQDAWQPLHTLEQMNPDHPVLRRIRQKIAAYSAPAGSS